MKNESLIPPPFDAQVNAVREFSQSICGREFSRVRRGVEPWARHTDCVENCLKMETGNGGRTLFGWHFILRPTPNGGWYLIATHHAVWLDPKDGYCTDITPVHPDVLNRPIGGDDFIVFLHDENALPKTYLCGSEARIVTLPLKFHAVTRDAPTIEYVVRKNSEELERYAAELGDCIEL